MIIDDHPVVRHGLRELLKTELDFEVCGEAGDADEALRLIPDLAPHLVIVDLSLGESSGIDLIKRLRALQPTLKVLVASMHDESFMAERALRAGAMGFASKHEPVERLIDAIRTVLANGMYLSPNMTSRLVQATVPHGVERHSPVTRLSDRELEVFEAIGHGRSTRTIAENLKLSVKTVETHRENIKRKLGLASSGELIQRAWQWILSGE